MVIKNDADMKVVISRAYKNITERENYQEYLKATLENFRKRLKACIAVSGAHFESLM